VRTQGLQLHINQPYEATKKAFKLASQDPMLIKTEHKNIRRALLSKFGDTLGLADVG